MARDEYIQSVNTTGIFASSNDADANLNVRPGEPALVFEDGYEETYSEGDGAKPTRAQHNYLFRIGTAVADLANRLGLSQPWRATQAYDANAFVRGSDGKYYAAVQASTGVDPTTDSDSSHWLIVNPDVVATPSATTSQAGTVRLATDSEVTSSSATDVVASLANIVSIINRLIPGSRLLPPNDGATDTFLAGDKTFRTLPTAAAATEAVAGVLRLATSAEASNASDVDAAMPPDLVRSVADARALLRAPDATNARKGIIEIADDTEATAGTLEDKAINPKQLNDATPDASTTAEGLVQLATTTDIESATANRAVTPNVMPLHKITTFTGTTPPASTSNIVELFVKLES